MTGFIEHGGRWCILRTGGPQTLKLVAALNRRGIPAWTPTMTVRRKRAGKRTLGAAAVMTEISAAIVPTFAFAPSSSAPELLAIRAASFDGLPAFRVLRLGDHMATVRDRALGALRDEEDIAASRYAALVHSEAAAKTADEQRQLRIAMLRNDQARRKALRAVRRTFNPGDGVSVSQVASFAGMTGIIQSGDGTSYLVRFGAGLEIKIEAWQLESTSLNDVPSLAD